MSLLTLFTTDFTKALAKYSFISSLTDSIGNLSGTFTRSTTKTFIHDDLTVDTAAIDAAAFTGSGVLLEPEATNLLIYSQDLSNAAWTKTTMTVNSNYINAPDGTLTADRVVATTTSSNIRQAVTITSGQKRYTSFSMKAGTSAYIFVDVGASGNAVRTWVNCSTGAIGTSINIGTGWTLAEARSTAVADGYFFIEIDVNTTGTSLVVFVGLANGDGTTGTTTNKTVYLWQFDNKENASSPIPTTSTALTRTVDAFTVPTTGWLANDFAFYFEWTCKADTGDLITLFREDYDANDYIYINHSGTAFNLRIIIDGSGDSTLNITESLVVGTKYKILVTSSSGVTTLTVNSTTVSGAGGNTVKHAASASLGKASAGVQGIGVFANFKPINTSNITLAQAEAL